MPMLRASGSAEPVLPVVWVAAQWHDCQNPDAIGFIEIDHSIRKHPCQIASGGRILEAKAMRGLGDLGDHPLNFIVELST